MGKTLTIVARRPDVALPYDQDPKDEGDGTIQALVAKLRALKDEDKTRNPVFRASSIQEVVKILADHGGGDVDLVQIVGHGNTGVLMLGEFWMLSDPAIASQRNPKLWYSIDENLNYSSILRGAVGQDKEVWLLGCSVGDAHDHESIADGPTTVFSLTRAWRCRVGAPWDIIGPENFDDAGIFKSSNTLVTVQRGGLAVVLPKVSEVLDGFARWVHGALRRDGLRTAAGKEPFTPVTLKRCTGVPLFASLGDSQCAAILGAVNYKLQAGALPAQISSAKLPVSALLGAPEFVFDATWDGSDWTAEIIGAGSLIRMLGPGPTRGQRAERYLQPSQPAHADIDEFYRLARATFQSQGLAGQQAQQNGAGLGAGANIGVNGPPVIGETVRDDAPRSNQGVG